MNAYVNYLIEANIGLLVSLLFYELLLRSETQFNFKRAYLLMGISSSVLFPLIKIQTTSDAIPSIGEVMSTYFLPELVIGSRVETVATSTFSYLVLIKWIYLAVSMLLLVGLIIKVGRMLIYLQKSKPSQVDGKFKIIESNTDLPTFSFFHYIFIGNITSFSQVEIPHKVTTVFRFKVTS